MSSTSQGVGFQATRHAVSAASGAGSLRGSEGSILKAKRSEQTTRKAAAILSSDLQAGASQHSRPAKRLRNSSYRSSQASLGTSAVTHLPAAHVSATPASASHVSATDTSAIEASEAAQNVLSPKPPTCFDKVSKDLNLLSNIAGFCMMNTPKVAIEEGIEKKSTASATQLNLVNKDFSIMYQNAHQVLMSALEKKLVIKDESTEFTRTFSPTQKKALQKILKRDELSDEAVKTPTRKLHILMKILTPSDELREKFYPRGALEVLTLSQVLDASNAYLHFLEEEKTSLFILANLLHRQIIEPPFQMFPEVETQSERVPLFSSMEDFQAYCELPESQELFSNFTTLDFSNGSYTIIPRGFLKLFPNVKVLKLNNSQIRCLDENAFQENLRLVHINLSNNSIPRLPDRLFHELIDLEFVYCSSNLIESLSRVVFAKSKKLDHIDLHNNRIREISPYAFSGLYKLEEVFLHGNLLEGLRKGDFIDLSSRVEIKLTNTRPQFTFN